MQAKPNLALCVNLISFAGKHQFCHLHDNGLGSSSLIKMIKIIVFGGLAPSAQVLPFFSPHDQGRLHNNTACNTTMTKRWEALMSWKSNLGSGTRSIVMEVMISIFPHKPFKLKQSLLLFAPMVLEKQGILYFERIWVHFLTSLI